jgi:hypothetical protein
MAAWCCSDCRIVSIRMVNKLNWLIGVKVLASLQPVEHALPLDPMRTLLRRRANVITLPRLTTVELGIFLELGEYTPRPMHRRGLIRPYGWYLTCQHVAILTSSAK